MNMQTAEQEFIHQEVKHQEMVEINQTTKISINKL